MRAFVVVSSLLAACRAEAGLPLAAGYGYAAGVAPYATYGAIAAAHNTYGLGYAAAAPIVNAAPIVKAAPVAPIVQAAPAVAVKAAPAVAVKAAEIAVPSVSSSQYRAGDELGNHAFGYSNINSARQESGNAEAGVVSGSYSYVDEAGVHTRNYVADAYGFRVTGDNLPVAPVAVHRRRRSVVAPLAYSGLATQAILPSAYTTNIVPAYNNGLLANAVIPAATYGANIAAVAPAATYAAAAPVAAVAPAATYAAAAPLAATYGANIVASAPAAREAILTTIKLNPGHATAYRVD